MTRIEFMKQLEGQLHKMAESERKEVLYDYEEHLQIAMENGKSEEDAVSSLGSPKTIAKEILAEYYYNQAEKQKNPTKVLRAVFATISLGFFNLIFTLGPFIAFLAIPIALFATAIALIVGSPVSGIALLSSGYVHDLALVIFAMLFIEGLGLLLLVASILLARLLTTGLVRYLRLNVKIIKGGI